MIGKLRIKTDWRWMRMMGQYDRRNRMRKRSIWDKFPRLKRFPTTGWTPEPGIMDGVGLVIVECDTRYNADGVIEGSTIEVHPIGSRVLEIDWARAERDLDYAVDLIVRTQFEYARMGKIEAERFLTIMDRLNDIIIEHGEIGHDL